MKDKFTIPFDVDDFNDIDMNTARTSPNIQVENSETITLSSSIVAEIHSIVPDGAGAGVFTKSKLLYLMRKGIEELKQGNE